MSSDETVWHSIAGNLQIGPNGEIMWKGRLINLIHGIYADETQSNGTTTNASVKSFNLPNNKYSRVIIESEVSVNGLPNTAFQVTLYISIGGVIQTSTQKVLKCSALGNNNSINLHSVLKYAVLQQDATTIAVGVLVNLDSATWIVNSLRIYGVLP